MSQNLKTEIEFEDASLSHVETDDEEAAVKEFLAKLAETEAAEERAKLVERTLICSCGHFTCPMVGMFGHPVPVFKEDIEPLFPQYARDVRALQLKGEGGSN